jgi:hypothetical protein
MKRSLFFIVGVVIAMFFATGCTKVVTQSYVYEVTISFDNANGNQLATKAYGDLKGMFCSTDAVLVYMKVDDSTGDDLWMPLPFIEGNFLFEYAFTDNGIFAFTADAGEGYTWTKNFSCTYRIVRIPRVTETSKSTDEVNTNDYNEVMKAYNLYEGNVIKMK